MRIDRPSVEAWSEIDVEALLAIETQIARVFVNRCTALLLEGALDVETAAIVKYWTTDLQCKVIDECVQLHGGYGYMREHPIARAYWMRAPNASPAERMKS